MPALETDAATSPALTEVDAECKPTTTAVDANAVFALLARDASTTALAVVDAAIKPAPAGARRGDLFPIHGKYEYGSVPEGYVDLGASSSSVPMSNVEAVLRTQIQLGAKRCYRKGLEKDPSQSGTLVIVIKVAADGQVDSVSAESNTGLAAQVWACTAAVAHGARFDAPGGNGATITVPFHFSK
jgi:hypothetical protein